MENNKNLARNKIAELDKMRLKQADSDQVMDFFKAFSVWRSVLALEFCCKYGSNFLNQDKTEVDCDYDYSQIFRECFVKNLKTHSVDIHDLTVDHDAESWINSASEPLAANIIMDMETYIEKTGMPSYQERIRFHQKFDLTACSKLVEEHLNKAWVSAIEYFDAQNAEQDVAQEKSFYQ